MIPDIEVKVHMWGVKQDKEEEVLCDQKGIRSENRGKIHTDVN